MKKISFLDNQKISYARFIDFISVGSYKLFLKLFYIVLFWVYVYKHFHGQATFLSMVIFIVLMTNFIDPLSFCHLICRIIFKKMVSNPYLTYAQSQREKWYTDELKTSKKYNVQHYDYNIPDRKSVTMQQMNDLLKIYF